LKKWWGCEAEFYFNKSYLFERQPIENDRFLEALRNRFNPNADSILLYRYEIGSFIGNHSDKKCFDKYVTLINLVDNEPDLFGNRPTTKFRWNRQNYELQHGAVIKFDSRVPHSVPPLKVARYSLQFREIAF
jgi:alkylated DNA repair dioxygenase AlkB